MRPTLYSIPFGQLSWPISNISSDPKSFLIPLSISGKNNCSFFRFQSLAQESSPVSYFNFLGLPLQMLRQDYMDTEICLSQSWGPKIQDQGEDGLLFLLCPYTAVPLRVSVA